MMKHSKFIDISYNIAERYVPSGPQREEIGQVGRCSSAIYSQFYNRATTDNKNDCLSI